MVADVERRCRRCGVKKEPGDFAVRHSSPDGRARVCKACEARSIREARKADAEMERKEAIVAWNQARFTAYPGLLREGLSEPSPLRYPLTGPARD